jgi:hypothetical protein
MTRNEAFQAAREASERIKQDAYAAANQLAVDCIDTADAVLRRDPFNQAGKAARERAYSAASDARAGMYAEAEQRHANRMAALARYLGQAYRGPGDPDADHALAFVNEIDPAGLWAPIARPAPIGTFTTINVAGIKRQVRVDANGRIVAESPVADDGWSNRGTFAGDTEAFIAAKRAGVGLGPEEEPADPGTPVVAPDEPQPITEPPPPGLLADIAAVLARTATK